jgi:hypothetical protein
MPATRTSLRQVLVPSIERVWLSMKRLLIVLAALLGTLFLTSAASAAPKPKESNPSDGPAVSPAKLHVRSVSPAEAAAAGHVPGALVEGSVVDATATGPSPAVTAALPSTNCWAVDIPVRWGLVYPFYQWVHAIDYWCSYGLGGPMTYRSTQVSLDGQYCSWHDPYSFWLAGGTGYTTVQYRAGGNFDCNSSVPFVTWHYNRWHNDQLTTWGGAWVTATS